MCQDKNYLEQLKKLKSRLIDADMELTFTKEINKILKSGNISGKIIIDE